MASVGAIFMHLYGDGLTIAWRAVVVDVESSVAGRRRSSGSGGTTALVLALVLALAFAGG